ncbi:MAG: matrixin family metalloprotease [Candidatus Pacearchaeota archaeon]|nr:matrixin family metalloprotease [Candidatus Pacearchaeota archaeon]
MGWKKILGYFIALILIALLVFYWVFPHINFGTASSRNYNFSLGASSNSSMQFYDNLRYSGKNISYSILDCPIGKKDEMKTAFDIIQNSTILNFYPANENEEISVTCDEKNRVKGGLFIGGEGGPTNISQSGSFNVISHGTILLIRESDCERPNIALHELLHALGFNHSENKKNIMYPVSKCNQIISQDILDTINSLYSVPSLPDLLFENISATMNGRYLGLNMTLRNNGFKEAPNGVIEVYADGKKIQDIEFGPLLTGQGRIMINNIFVLQKSINELRFFINADFEELEKENNEAILKYKS